MNTKRCAQCARTMPVESFRRLGKGAAKRCNDCSQAKCAAAWLTRLPVGTRVGRLNIVGHDGFGRFMCVCDCGADVRVRHDCMVGPKPTQSCGCLARDTARALYRGSGPPNKTHGMSGTLEYRVWTMMLQRCRNRSNSAWASYGGRGVEVCDRWADSFDAFLADMGHRPTPGATLERINNDGPYAPGNVRWATRTEQARNRRSTAYVTMNGESLSIAEWAERFGVPYKRLWERLRSGMPLDCAVTLPIRPGVSQLRHAGDSA